MTYRTKYVHTVMFWTYSLFAICLLGLCTGCAGVKNPPRGVPYAYNNDILVRSEDLNGEQRTLLKEKLLEYLDDSLQVQSVQVLGRTRRINPPVFDSANIGRSIRFMNGYLNSLGYYRSRFDSFTVKKELKPERNEIRMSTTFYVTLGKRMKVDNLIYDFRNIELQHLADSVKSRSQILPGMPYSKEKVAAELDRLSAVFRQNGFMRVTRSALLAEADTNDLTLLDPYASPLDLVSRAIRRQSEPRINLKILQRPGMDTGIFARYFIDSVFIYPESLTSKDAATTLQDSSYETYLLAPGVLLKTKAHLFQHKFLARNNFLKPGDLYRETDYFKTLNSYSQAGPWSQVDGRSFTRFDSLPLANYHLFLYPSSKQTFQVDIEGSQNNNISVSNVLAGRFLALALNVSHRNRNVFKNGTSSTTAATFGFELNNTQTSATPNFFQTFIALVSQRYSLPKLIGPFGWLEQKGRTDYGRTNLNLSAFYTERFKFFQQTSVNTNLQWEWRKGRNTTTFTLPNFETVFLRQYQDSLDKVIEQNPALRYAFTPGNILSTRIALERSVRYKKENHYGFYRLSGELALRPGFDLFNNDFFTFYLMQGQYVEGIRYRRSSLHYRLYTGIGWDLSSTRDATMPFFRQFVAGGSNSMRAWVLRQLGLGNSLVSDTATFTDRFGDIQLEANIEYRFKLFRFFGYNLQGATFLDVGNIWNHKNNADGSGKLELRHLYRDLAMNVGLGIRWDLSYLVVRLDAAYKVKDPVRNGAGWMDTFEWRGTNRLGGYERSNVGVQFGIGYPF